MSVVNSNTSPACHSAVVSARPRGTLHAVMTLCSLLAIACIASTASAAQDKADKKAEKSAVEREQQLEAARKRLDDAAREVAELSMALSEDAMPMVEHAFGRAVPRAMLGINIGAGRQDKRKDGVEIVGVSPGGPAADAGLKAGDVLVELKGKSLKGDDESPRQKLLEVMGDVEPEEKVSARYMREGKSGVATLVARPADRLRPMPFAFHGPGPIEGPNVMFMRHEGVFGSAELVSLTPKLGQYFGTDKGLLVVRAPSDARLQLEDGDVIVEIDGRVPSSPSHALRILSSYNSGEKLKINLMRMKKRMTLDVTIPEQAGWERRVGPKGEVAPAPPPAPAVLPAPPPREDAA